MQTPAFHRVGSLTLQFHPIPLGPVAALLPDLPGIYAFCKENPSAGNFRALYIGKAASFRDRVTPAHETWSLARAMGMSAVSISLCADPALRAELEAKLIDQLEPVLNMPRHSNTLLRVVR